MCSFQRIAESVSDTIFKIFGGNTAVVRPVPIPNTAVKHCKADGSGCIASARVGSRQSFKKAGEMFSGFFLFCALDFKPTWARISLMRLPTEPVTLSVEQIRELKDKLADLQHDVNNSVSLMLAAVELIRVRPEARESMMDSFSRHPKKIIETVTQFTRSLEGTIGITRP
jgi:hypothetical protein